MMTPTTSASVAVFNSLGAGELRLTSADPMYSRF